jgi:tetraacyldisaccharide 4'-kinase
VLDDAYQHRAVSPQRCYSRSWPPLSTTRCCPPNTRASGGARRADVIIVTKCPPGMAAETKTVVEQLSDYGSAGRALFVLRIRCRRALALRVLEGFRRSRQL